MRSLTALNVKNRNWELLKNLFRWPTAVATILLGILLFLVTDLIPHGKWMINTSFLIGFVPLLFLLPDTLRCTWKYIKRERYLFNSAKSTAISTQLALVINLGWYIPMLIITNFFEVKIAEVIPMPLFACLLFWYVLFSVSFYQLYREQFKVKIAY